MSDVSKKVVAVSLVAAAASVAAYIYFKNKKNKRKPNLPVKFI